MKETRDKSNYFLTILLALILSMAFVGREAEGVPVSIVNEFKLSKNLCKETKGGKEVMRYVPEDWKVDAKIVRDKDSIRSCVSMEHKEREIIIKLDTEKTQIENKEKIIEIIKGL